MSKTCYQTLVEDNILLPADIRQTSEDLVVTYTTSRADGTQNLGHVIAQFGATSPSQVIVTSVEGDYGPPSTALAGDTMWIAHTSYANGKRSILIHAVQQRERTASVTLVASSKVDNPAIAIHRGQLYAVWEDYTTGDARIVVQILNPQTLAPVGSATPVTGPKAYKPQLLSDETHLYLVYEQFGHGRYRLMVSSWQPDIATFAAPVEIGFEEGNDQDAALAIHEGELLVVWENSSPLAKGYAWTSPAGNTVVMPGFGHGWRVETRMGLRRAAFDGADWHLENLCSNGADPACQAIDAQEAAGAPSLQVINGTLYVSYVRWERGPDKLPHGWQIVTKTFNGRRWIPVGISGLTQKQRVRPAVWVDATAGRLYVAGHDPQVEAGAWDVWTQQSAATYLAAMDLPSPAGVHPPAFATAWRSQRVRPATEAEPKPVTVTFEDGERRLLWGDLHMHSNLSVCSLGERFHCTEIEKKYRFSRDVADLDFALNTDHDAMSDHEWHRNSAAAHFHNMPGNFIAFNGFEWTCSHFDDRPNYGHYNVLYRADGPMLRTLNPDYERIDQVRDHLSPEDALAIPHHPGDNAHPLDWNAFDPEFSPLVEIFQVRGSYEYDNCPMHPELYGRRTVRKHSLQYGLNRGFDFGFTAGGEHEGVGITGVYAESFTREGIFAALRERRTFGTTGARMVVDFRLDGKPMGSKIQATGNSVEGTLSVTGTDTIVAIKVVLNGKTVRSWTPDSVKATVTWTEELGDLSTNAGRSYVYCVVQQADEEIAWTSPIFITQD